MAGHGYSDVRAVLLGSRNPSLRRAARSAPISVRQRTMAAASGRASTVPPSRELAGLEPATSVRCRRKPSPPVAAGSLEHTTTRFRRCSALAPVARCRSARDESGATAVGREAERPADENEQPVLEADQVPE